MKWLKILFCSHPALSSSEVGDYGLGGETRIIYTSPWTLFGTKEIHYHCNKCGANYWLPKGNQAEREMNEKLMEFLTHPNKTN